MLSGAGFSINQPTTSPSPLPEKLGLENLPHEGRGGLEFLVKDHCLGLHPGRKALRGERFTRRSHSEPGPGPGENEASPRRGPLESHPATGNPGEPDSRPDLCSRQASREKGQATTAESTGEWGILRRR